MRWKNVLIITCLISFFSSLGAQGEPKLVSDKELGAILANFEQYAEKSMRDWETPGMAVTIVRGNNIVYTKAFGVKTDGGNDPIATAVK